MHAKADSINRRPIYIGIARSNVKVCEKKIKSKDEQFLADNNFHEIIYYI
jgi:hypothetical protein